MARKIILLLSVFLLTAVTITPAPVAGQETPAPIPPQEQIQPPAAPPQAVAPSTPQVIPPPGAPESRLLPPPTVAARSADMVSLNFNRAELVEVIHVLAQHLKLTYTIDPEVKGTVTINSAEPLKRDDLLPIFHQVLRMNGAVAVKTGEMYRIAPIKEGKGLARPFDQGKEDSYAIQVIPTRFFSVAEMKKLLAPFVTPGGELLDYPRGNFFIIVDLPSNIQRLMEIRDLIDVSTLTGTRMEIYQPKVASAEELAAEMAKIMQIYASSAAQAEGFAAQFLPIPRINQLLVISHSDAAWTYAKRWLERIDAVGEGPGRRIFIYPVENGKATELADILNQVLGQPSAARRETPRTLQDLHRGVPTAPGTPGAPRPGLPPLGAPGTAPSTGSQVPPLGAYAAAPLPVQPPLGVPTPSPAAPATPTAPGARPQEQLRIVPDPATNSLIIYGTAQEFQNIKNILKELDIMPRQVLMDVLVAEVTLGDDLSFGVEYELRRRGGNVRIFDREFGSRASILSGTLPSAAATGLTRFPTGISAVIGTGDDVRIFINALMKDSRVKVLSSPTILATDNRPARIQVGTEEPIPTGSVQSPVSGGTITSSTTIQYRNTGRILTIIPQVNSQGLVHLQIKAEVSQRGVDVRVGQDSFPSFDTRDAETTAVVQDGETLVIGGIITDRKSRSRTGIPYLMDIPVLGRFFGTTTDDIDRTELVMLITPHVIRNREEAKSVTEEFKEKLSTVTREIERMRRESPAAKQP
ncbi:MAG: type II secretion system secretin GspD [Deltaproteobacteria bacterium]|nr:type II secretion system secretin GspD [Deltaproteobacteria bacterium]